jgi:hypothetical protein
MINKQLHTCDAIKRDLVSRAAINVAHVIGIDIGEQMVTVGLRGADGDPVESKRFFPREGRATGGARPFHIGSAQRLGKAF